MFQDLGLRNWCDLYFMIRPTFNQQGVQRGAQLCMKSPAHLICMKRVCYEKFDYLLERGWKLWASSDPERTTIKNLPQN
jgi:hypothetical protein